MKPPEWRIGGTTMAATVVANFQTDIKLFILILNQDYRQMQVSNLPLSGSTSLR